MKHLKIALVLAALTIMASACSKVKTTNLIGTYKSGNSSMTVSTDGQVNFNIASDATGALASLDNIYGVTLVPWDLTSEKTSYDFSDTARGSSYDQTTYVSTTYDVSLSFNFTKDNETVTCKVNVSLPEANGTSGEVTFTK